MQKYDIQSILNILFGIDIPPSKWKVISTNRHVVLSFGEVVSLIRKPRILKKTISNAGYYYVSIMKNGKPEKQLIHRLVADCFLSGCAKQTVNHIDGNKTNNDFSNLEWATYAENNKHARDNRLNNCRLELHHSSRLTVDDVIKIRKEVGSATHDQIAKKYSTSRSNIGKILSGKAWKI